MRFEGRHAIHAARPKRPSTRTDFTNPVSKELLVGPVQQMPTAISERMLAAQK